MSRARNAVLNNEAITSELLLEIREEVGGLFVDAKTRLLYIANELDDKGYALQVLCFESGNIPWDSWSAQLVEWLADIAGDNKVALTVITRVCCWRQRQVDLFDALIRIRNPNKDELIREIVTKTVCQYYTPNKIIDAIFRECPIVIEKAPLWSVHVRSPTKAFHLFINFDLADRISLRAFYSAGEGSGCWLDHAEVMNLKGFFEIFYSGHCGSLAIFDTIEVYDLVGFVHFLVCCVLKVPINLELFELVFNKLQAADLAGRKKIRKWTRHIADRVRSPHRMRALGLCDTLF